jgi:hypothetical protein
MLSLLRSIEENETHPSIAPLDRDPIAVAHALLGTTHVTAHE